MKQLNLFDDCTGNVASQGKQAVWKLFIDGASRRNPGKAGAGICLMKYDVPVFQKGFYVKERTNNQAEYLALLLGVFYSHKYMTGNDTLHIFSDSELLVKHMKGMYKIKDATLKQLFDIAVHLLQKMSYVFCHIPRELNTVADQLANEGIDKRHPVSQEFLSLLQKHGIAW